jgi:hypothetical protein
MEYQTFMIWLLSQLPLVYVITTGVLISWGIMIVAAFYSIKHNIINNTQTDERRRVRRCDTVHTIVTSVLVLVSAGSLIFTPLYVSEYIDLVLLLNCWVSAYYAYVSLTSLKSWPEMICTHCLRSTGDES